jgi:AcrR family transcriptional regulator
MKHDVTTYLTKSAIVTSLKKLMSQKALNKISICELCRDCGINRKTFYYHFVDIYDIVSWMFKQELKNKDEYRSYEEAIRYSIQYGRENRLICNSLLADTMGREMACTYLKNEAIDMLSNTIHNICNRNYPHVTKQFQDFIINYYSDGFAAYIIKIIKDGDVNENESENVTQNLTVMLEATLPAVLQAMELRK